ncbi:hypothetical protein DK853_44915, partial [Klebsiella oxytoca]
MQAPKQGENSAHNMQKNVQQAERPLDTILNQLRGEKPQTLPDKLISLIREGVRGEKLELRDVKQLLMDSDL